MEDSENKKVAEQDRASKTGNADTAKNWQPHTEVKGRI